MLKKRDILANLWNYASTISTPFYLYDSESIRKICNDFKEIPYEYKSIHFATMANIHPDFLKIIKKEGLHVFVNSVEHLKAVQEIGFKESEIIFTASAMSGKTMELLQQEGIQVNLDSELQLELWLRKFPDTPVGIRCNIGDHVKPIDNHAGCFIGSKSRLGFTREEIARIDQKEMICGLHLYAGTDIFDIDYMLDCYKDLTGFTAWFPNLEYLNFGGGFGVSETGDSQFDFERYGRQVAKLMKETSNEFGRPLKMILEPGRIIGASAGYFVCKVNDIKVRDQITLVGVNASSVQFPRPLFYPETAKHPVTILRNGEAVCDEPFQMYSIYGCSTYSRDFLARDIQLPKIKPGDTLVFGNAGSYCSSLYTQFLGFQKPKEYFM
jgi:diaminopimelate decarboxylase